MADFNAAWLESDDSAILTSLVTLLREESDEERAPLFLEEFSLYGGEARVDLAVVNGCIHGYEIKSRRDSLSRLASQAEIYSEVLDRVSLVAPDHHLKEARGIIPTWWGLVRVVGTPEGLSLTQVRLPRQNPTEQAEGLAWLLWRSEALELLASLGLDSGLRSKPMANLVDRLRQSLPRDRVSALVREALRARGDWLAGARRKQDGGRYRQRASWSGCRPVRRARIVR